VNNNNNNTNNNNNNASKKLNISRFEHRNITTRRPPARGTCEQQLTNATRKKLNISRIEHRNIRIFLQPDNIIFFVGLFCLTLKLSFECLFNPKLINFDLNLN